jgi:mRNA-degrading endonuclease RelE of RelBE toxin-antitoxin system
LQRSIKKLKDQQVREKEERKYELAELTQLTGLFKNVQKLFDDLCSILQNLVEKRTKNLNSDSRYFYKKKHNNYSTSYRYIEKKF